MQKIPINLAREGMVLEKPVMRDNGMVLVGEGTEITPKLVQRLENMGISKIVVKGEPVDMEGMAGGTSFSKRAERLDHLFRQFSEDEWMQQVKEFVRSYFQQKAAEEAAFSESTGE